MQARELCKRIEASGLASYDSCMAAWQAAGTGQSPEELLVSSGVVSDVAMSKLVAAAYLLPFVQLADVEVNLAAAKLVPQSVAEFFRVLPIQIEGDCLVVAVAVPLELAGEDLITFITGYKVRRLVVSQSDLSQGINYAYHGVKPSWLTAASLPRAAVSKCQSPAVFDSASLQALEASDSSEAIKANCALFASSLEQVKAVESIVLQHNVDVLGDDTEAAVASGDSESSFAVSGGQFARGGYSRLAASIDEAKTPASRWNSAVEELLPPAFSSAAVGSAPTKPVAADYLTKSVTYAEPLVSDYCGSALDQAPVAGANGLAPDSSSLPSRPEIDCCLKLNLAQLQQLVLKASRLGAKEVVWRAEPELGLYLRIGEHLQKVSPEELDSRPRSYVIGQVWHLS